MRGGSDISQPVSAIRRRIPAPSGFDTGTYWLLALVVAVLNLIGLVMVLSASSVSSHWGDFTRQSLWTMLGVAALLVTLYVDLDTWRRHIKVGLIATCALLVIVLIPGLGVTANGATRWIGFGPIQIQPSELTKLVLLMFVSDLLARRLDRITDVRFSVRPVVGVFGLIAGLIMLQPNLGTTIVLGVIVFAVLFASGAPLRSMAGYGVAGAVAACVLAFTETYRRARMMSFLDPWATRETTGYQLTQSQVGIASGGWFGVGLGQSRAKWGFLPFAHTDFIFSIIGEELGLVGAALVIALYIALAVLGLRAAARAADAFGRLVAVGVTTWLVVQAFVNIGVVIGILPITGVPLPFISFGGSSLLVTLAATGLLLNVARHPAEVREGSARRGARSPLGSRKARPARRARGAAGGLGLARPSTIARRG